MSTNTNHPNNNNSPALTPVPTPAATQSVPSEPAEVKATPEAERAARAAARAAAKEQRRQAALQELRAIENVQERIDRVAADLQRRRKRYKLIDAWDLAELLEVGDLDDRSDDWAEFHLRRIPQLEEDAYRHPFAENVELLEGVVSPERWEELSQQSEAICRRSKGPDLTLTPKEEAALREAYKALNEDDCGILLRIRCLEATNGDEVCFRVVIGDAGQVDEVWSPYEEGLDTSKYEEVE